MAASAGANFFPSGSTVSSGLVDWPGGMVVFAVCCANFNGATVSLQALGPDAATLLDVGINTTLTGNGMGTFWLAPCQIKVTIRTAVPLSPVYAAAARVVS